MKHLLLTILLVGIGYSQCNESNWEEYYPEMAECDLEEANLEGANLKDIIYDKNTKYDEGSPLDIYIQQNKSK